MDITAGNRRLRARAAGYSVSLVCFHLLFFYRVYVQTVIQIAYSLYRRGLGL